MKTVFDRYHKKYDAWYDRNKLAYLSELEAIKKVLPKTGKGLEIGVGTGRFAAPLGIGFGIDPSYPMLTIAKRRGVDARFGFGEKIPFKNSLFDYIAIIITLAFTEDPVKVLKEARRVLKKSGKIIIAIVDKNSFLGKAYEKKKAVFYKDANLLTAKDIITLLEVMNFKYINSCQTIFTLPGNIKHIEKPLKGFGKGGFVVICAKKQ